MPGLPLPPELTEFLALPNAAVVATLRPDGSPHTVATWYDWDDGRALLNMDVERVRLAHIRRDQRVALTVLGEDWDMHVSLLGRVVEIYDDVELADIDRLARRYAGAPFSRRDRARVSAWLLPERWHGWNGPGPLLPPP
jgi:PPOX class probable F420-dependent enzyme